MKTSIFLARRMRLGVDGSRRSKMAVLVPVIGVALSVVIMLLTIAVVSGFKYEITQKVIGFDSQITIAEKTDDIVNNPVIEVDSLLIDAIRSAAPEAVVSLAVRQPGMLKTNDDFEAVVFRGYDDIEKWNFVKNNIVKGEFPFIYYDNETEEQQSEKENSIIISSIIADKLALSVGDKVNVCFFIDGNVRLRNFSVAAIFDTNFSDYDSSIAYASPDVMRSLRSMSPNQASVIEITNLEVNRISPVAEKLKNALDSNFNQLISNKEYSVTPVTQTGAMYFNWLSLLNTNVVVILSLMSAISIFTLISSLFILILERVSMIGTLKALGATDAMIRRTFILLASRIFLRGLVAGNIIGLGIIAIQYFTHFVKLNPDSYYVSFVPVEISPLQILTLNAVALVVCFAVMIIPSHIIMKMKPAKTMRYE